MHTALVLCGAMVWYHIRVLQTCIGILLEYIVFSAPKNEVHINIKNYWGLQAATFPTSHECLEKYFEPLIAANML